MIITYSKEVRWFLHEKERQAILKWFDLVKTNSREDEQSREDLYLKMPGVKNLGIKRRGSNGMQSSKPNHSAFEVKQQLFDDESVDFGNNINGIANYWRKFSYTSGESQQLPVDNQSWISLAKTRKLLMLDTSIGKIIWNAEALTQGCGIELTTILSNGSTYFTFGLEAFASSPDACNVPFEAGTKWLFSQLLVPGLHSEKSYAYPAFINKLL